MLRKDWSVKDLMEFPPPKRIMWKTWTKNLDQKDKQVIELMKGKVYAALKSKDIHLEICVQPVPEGKVAFGDYGMDIVSEKYEGRDASFIIFEILLDPKEKHFYPILSSDLLLNHDLKTKQDRENAYEVLSEFFNIEWDKSDEKAIFIESIKTS